MKNVPVSSTEATRTAGKSSDGKVAFFIWLAFALLLGFTILRHEMWCDELQAFLIARDSYSLPELFRNLRYEGHPALWYLLLLIPSHISWNPAGMQILNFLLALVETRLILSVRELKLVVRILLIFSFTLFYTDGTLARSYMLAALLLTSALLSYKLERKNNYLTVIFLALAVNTHFFVIPIAFFLAVWMLFQKLPRGHIEFLKHLRSRDTWAFGFALLLGLLCAYLTIRPPADEFLPSYGRVTYSLGHNLLVSLSGIWAGIFVPFPLVRASAFLLHILPTRDNAPLLSILFSLLCLFLATLTLRTARARAFFVLICATEILAFACTVHLPELRHYGMLFVAFLLALIIDARSSSVPSSRFQIKPAISFALLLTFLTLQASYGLYAAARDWFEPYSYARATALWLRDNHLDSLPILLDDAYGPSLIGYLERPSIHYAACDCDSSFYKYATGWDYQRRVTADEIVRLHAATNQPVLVISKYKFNSAELQSLHVQEIKEFSGQVLSVVERYFIYQEISH